jgi:AraC-like DNA-binding protein
MFALSPNRDLILIRVEKAKNSSCRAKTVARTAACLGYANVSHFNTSVQAGTHVSPGRYGRPAEPRP